VLSRRIEQFGACNDGQDVWRALGWNEPSQVPMLDTPEFLQLAQTRTAR